LLLRNHVGDLLDEDFLLHYAVGIAGGGLPSAAMLAYALAEGDEESIEEALLVEAAVLGTFYSMLQIINYVSGPKYALSFHQAHQGMQVMRGMLLPSVAIASVPAVVASTTAVVYEKAVNEEIRQGRSGFDISWLGPFASGFGSVV
jgi:hypothetical protein